MYYDLVHPGHDQTYHLNNTFNTTTLVQRGYISGFKKKSLLQMRIFRLPYVWNLYKLLQSNNTDILGNEYQINNLKSHPILPRRYL